MNALSVVLPLFATLLLTSCESTRSDVSPGAYRAFDAFSAEEIGRSVAAARAQSIVAPTARIVSVVLDEPDKAAVLSGRTVERVARVLSYDMAADETVETRVNATDGRVLSSLIIPGVQPTLGGEDAARAQEIVNAHAPWVDALRRRGVTDLSKVFAASWSAGYFGDSTQRGRLVRVIPSLREGARDNVFMRPIEGVAALVNLTSGRVESLTDEEIMPISAASRFSELSDNAPSPRNEVVSNTIVVTGGHVRWRNWQLHVSADSREGVVLHRVSYTHEGRERSLLYRAAVSEMVVPYGDPAAGWYVRNALDAGEIGLGQFTLPLREGVDVPNGATFLSATLVGGDGTPVERERAIALYERDGGLAWRYMNLARRSRQLVIEWISPVGNYEYAFAWIFHEDGVIEQRTTLTGIMSVKGANRASDSAAAHGQRVSDRIIAPHHQHFFAFRLDTDVDGAAAQRVLEVDAQPSVEHDAHNSRAEVHARSQVLESELSARRTTAGASARRWVVQNTGVLNSVGEPSALSVLPGENSAPLADTAAWIRKRAGFIDAQLWVTPYRRNELYAAGDFPNQSRGGEGLPAFTRGNAPVANADVVLWYVMGITHLPRPEDWPVMPSHVAGFKLVPTGFFSHNPLVRMDTAR
jgi:primary-amine oxidase